MDDDDHAADIEEAVAGFRRAEAALVTIVAGADRLVEARGEVQQARDELKVVAGALVGLVTASRDLIGQLGEAAAALRPVERADDDRLVVTLREAEAARARQVAEVAESVEELARRLDRALTERVGGMVAGLPSAEQVDEMASRLNGLATSSDLAALERRVVGQLSAEGPDATAPPAEEVAELAATQVARAVEKQMASLFDQVQAGQRRVHLMVLAVGVSFLLFAALISVLALR